MGSAIVSISFTDLFPLLQWFRAVFPGFKAIGNKRKKSYDTCRDVALENHQQRGAGDDETAAELDTEDEPLESCMFVEVEGGIDIYELQIPLPEPLRHPERADCRCAAHRLSRVVHYRSLGGGVDPRELSGGSCVVSLRNQANRLTKGIIFTTNESWRVKTWE